MRELGIDIETYSSNDLPSCGVYKYTEARDFTILLFAYSVDNGPVQLVDFACGETLPSDIYIALRDPAVLKTAFNAAFERVCISRYFGWPLMDPSQWYCTMVGAARMGLPLSLGQCSEVLFRDKDDQKMREGAALIRKFSKPNGGKRIRPEDAPDKWAVFRQYCVRDVEVEQRILAKVRCMPVPSWERELQVADQEINDRGVLMDERFIVNAERFDTEYKAELLKEARELTGAENPNSVTQIKAYIKAKTGISVESLNKKSLEDIEAQMKRHPDVLRLLAMRRELGKTSNKKYTAMLECLCDDGRIHGLLQFYGAARTGRWAGRLVQIQNLPQNHLTDLDFARSLVKGGDLDEFELNYANPPQVLSELIRTAFVPKEGCVFHVCDFSAVEARVIAWLAGETWVLDVFEQGGDIYCANASKMFGKPVEKHGQNAELRPKGKIATLALGYGGATAALDAMGGSKMGLSQAEMVDITRRWRRANPRIVKLWQIIEDAVYRVIETGDEQTINRNIKIRKEWGALLITLPSGRTICYPRVRKGTELKEEWRCMHDVIEYEGVNQTTRKWEMVRTYGGKLTENVVQAIARDILGVVILRARERGLNIVFHVHDEIIVEATPDQPLQAVEEIFSMPISWAKGLPLTGAGYSGNYYYKD